MERVKDPDIRDKIDPVNELFKQRGMNAKVAVFDAGKTSSLRYCLILRNFNEQETIELNRHKSLTKIWLVLDGFWCALSWMPRLTKEEQ